MVDEKKSPITRTPYIVVIQSAKCRAATLVPIDGECWNDTGAKDASLIFTSLQLVNRHFSNKTFASLDALQGMFQEKKMVSPNAY